jgi:Reverse transcriptase (RNA-dependent DNA polymerase)/Endonuclease-reverse transcriptase
MQYINILQFNCGNSNNKSARPIFDSVSPARHVLLAIQEPAFSSHTRTTYCPGAYTLACENDPTTKVCFMVDRNLDLAQWSYKSYSRHVAAITLQLANGPITVINVYNPRGSGSQICAWGLIQQAINDATGEILLLGDFNAHHPAWGGIQAATEPQGSHLRNEVAKQGLHLITPQGLPTWKRGQLQSVIDLTFATAGIRDAIYQCGPVNEWTINEDHIPIDIQIGLARATKTESTRLALQKADWPAIERHVSNSQWAQAEEPLVHLQQTIQAALKEHCPVTRPSNWARPNWSPQAAVLLAGARRARRRHNASGTEHDREAYRSLQNQLKKETQRVSRANWRRYINDSTSAAVPLHNKNLWKISRWSRQRAGKSQPPIHLPAMRKTEQDTSTDDNNEKIKILTDKFFPNEEQADLSDIDSETQPERILNLLPEVTEQDLEQIIKKLPNNKASGPDGIPNEVIKHLRSLIQADLAVAISRHFAAGTLPASYRESTTIALRKEGKKDYTIPGSYRPIALENTLAKLVEKVLATQITQVAEEHNLLPWNQMGARKQRSTLSALELLTGCVQTAWRARPGCVVSMLSLDLGGAFDNVSHDRLLWIMRTKGYPTWIIQAIRNFLKERRTKITIPGFTSNWITTETGIPQGSPLSPVLFLFFISELLSTFQSVHDGTLAFGFVDDTNIVAWGDTAQDNCRRLQDAHDKCISWARRHGASFAPDKYQLIHFTKRRRDPVRDITSTVRIASHEIQPQKFLRVLGVWVDPKMDWKEHITRATRKGNAAYEAMTRLVSSTWGPSMRRSRLIYSAVVRPTLLYGTQIWSIDNSSKEMMVKSMTKPLKKAQNQCLRKVLGAYKRTPTAALEREAAVPPIDIYASLLANERAASTRGFPVTEAIKVATNDIWTSLERRRPAGRRRGRQPRPQGPRPATAMESLRVMAAAKEVTVSRYQEKVRHEARQKELAEGAQRVGGILGWNLTRGLPTEERRRNAPQTGGHRHKHCKNTPLAIWHDALWRKRWKSQANGRTATTWQSPWPFQTVKLYEDLQKHEATALFLLRTEVIGLNAWLFSVNVPEVLPRCTCDWHTQSVRHILISCPLYSQQRTELYLQAGSMDFTEILSTPRGAQAAGRWLIRCGILPHLRLAGQIQQEDTGDQIPFPELCQ